MTLALPDLVWAALRAAALVLLMQSVGATLFIAVCGGLLAHSLPLIRRTAQRAAVLALAALAGQWCIEPARLAGEWAGLADASLWRLAVTSPAAAAVGLRLAGIAVTVIALRTPGAAARRAGVAGAAVVLGSFALTGHTTLIAARLLGATLLLTHVTIVAFWFGSLLPLRQLCVRESRASAAAAIDTFSRMALRLVPLIPVAGVGLAALLLPDLRALLAPYGLLLLGKLTLFAALLALAARNKLRLAPALARAAPGAGPAFQRAVTAEYVIICVVLVLTSVLTGFFSPLPA